MLRVVRLAWITTSAIEVQRVLRGHGGVACRASIRRIATEEFVTLELRAEFFNLFNIVNFGLPSNIVSGSGFGIISKTAGNSRQIQFSLKVIY
jgi:hypothetical protein